MRPDARAERELKDLAPDLHIRVRALIEACPHPISIRSAWRSRAEQQRLYDGWKARKPGFNPANPPGMSRHEDSGRSGEPASNAADLIYGNAQALGWAHERDVEFGLHFPIRRENWHVESNGRPYTPPEDIVASKDELREVVREEVDRLSGGPRRADRKDTDVKTLSVADVYTLVEKVAAAQGQIDGRLARIEKALGEGR